MIDWAVLEELAFEVRKHAHAPYSGYPVGAALFTKSGRAFVGCNVENASYGLSICAERSALVQMIAAGERAPTAIVVVTRGPVLGMPCGACRQMLAEFVEDVPIRLLTDGGAVRTTTLSALLPDAFRANALGR